MIFDHAQRNVAALVHDGGIDFGDLAGIRIEDHYRSLAAPAEIQAREVDFPLHEHDSIPAANGRIVAPLRIGNLRQPPVATQEDRIVVELEVPVEGDSFRCR